jgi:hypothetical protein
MRNGQIGFFGVIVLGATIVSTGCSSTSSNGGAAGASSGSAGTSGSAGSAGSGTSGTSGAGTSGASGSGTSGASGGGGVTSISGSKSLASLSAAEATQLCNDTYAYFATAIPAANTCKWKGLVFAASSSAPSQDVLQQNCSGQETTCQQDGNPWANNSGCNELPTSGCTSTVSDYSTCIADEVAAFIQTVNGFPSCSELTSPQASMVFDAEGAPAPASCMSLDAACTGVYPPSPLY